MRRLGAETGTAPDSITLPGTRPSSPIRDGDQPATAGQLLYWLQTAAFPGNREIFITAAANNQAPQWLVDSLRRLPPALVFQNAEQLATALRKRRARPVRRRL